MKAVSFSAHGAKQFERSGDGACECRTHSGGRKGGGHGDLIACKQLNLTRPMDSFSAIAKNWARESIPT